jgi:hypothetical protein
MAAAQHKLSRRAVLAGACAGVAVPLSRHSGPFDLAQDRLDPESILPLPRPGRKWTPDQVRDGEGVGDGKWRRALARFARAEAGVEAAGRFDDDRLYDRALGRHNADAGAQPRSRGGEARPYPAAQRVRAQFRRGAAGGAARGRTAVRRAPFAPPREIAFSVPAIPKRGVKGGVPGRAKARAPISPSIIDTAPPQPLTPAPWRPFAGSHG